MKQRGYLIILSACFVITACRSDIGSTPTPPASDLNQESSESALPDQVSSQNETPSPSLSDESTGSDLANSSQLDTGSALTASVSDLDGLVTDLDGRVTETEIIVDLPADVLFDFDKANIRPDAVPTLQKLARLISSVDSKSVQVNGHTDSKGSDDYNMELSQRRAESVGAWLIAKGGTEAGRLQTVGYGETKPAASNELPSGADDPEGRAKNRRVEIIILK